MKEAEAPEVLVPAPEVLVLAPEVLVLEVLHGNRRDPPSTRILSDSRKTRRREVKTWKVG